MLQEHSRYKPRDFDFAQQLATLRRRMGLTQEEVALNIGVTVRAVRNWEGGSHYISESNLQKLIELYLDKNVFTPECEQDEAHSLWDQLRERIPHRIGPFDEQWFARVGKEWQARRTRHTEPLERGEAAFQAQPAGESTQEQRIADLERLCGQLALENHVLKKALQSAESRSGMR